MASTSTEPARVAEPEVADEAGSLTDQLERSADDVLALRERVSLVALIRALIKAYRTGNREFEL